MTAIEWLEEQMKTKNFIYLDRTKILDKAKEMEKQQKGYSEEEARAIWRAGQEYWKTSGDSITFEELTEKLKTKYPVKTKDRIISETSEETKQKAIDYGNSLVKGTFEEQF